MEFIAAIVVAVLSTAPSSQPSNEADLRRIIVGLQQQIMVLKAENAQLEGRLMGSPPVADAVASKPANTFTSRARLKKFIGYSSEERAAFLLSAQKKDKEVAAYIARNNVTPAVAAAMYAGRYEIGMSEDAVRIISCRSDEISTTENTKVLSAGIWQPDPVGEIPLDQLLIEGGKITRIDHEVDHTKFAN